MHAGEVGLSQHGGDPQLLRVDVGPNQVVPGRHLHHGLKLAAHSVPLRTQETARVALLLQASRSLGSRLFEGRTRALLAVSHVGSTARRVTVPAVTT